MYKPRIEIRKLHIIPVQSKDVLYSADEVVRIGEKKLLQSDEDWNFLSEYLLVVNQYWPRFLADQRREAEENKDNNLQRAVEEAYSVLKAIGMEETSDVSTMIERVASLFFAKSPLDKNRCIKLAQIACKMNATIGSSFNYVSRDKHARNINNVMLFDEDGRLESLLPDNWCLKHFLHQDYINCFESCSAEEWKQWIQSGRAGIHTFPPLVKKDISIYSKEGLQNELNKRNFKGSFYYHYVTNYFEIEDWDFDDDHWSHWKIIQEDEDDFWGRLFERIIKQPPTYWSKATNAKINQVATTGTTRSITYDPLLPKWILKLRELPCLPDTRGFYQKPSDLLCRTPETESLMDVEPFIHGSYDTESVRPLLILLGVGNKPTGPEKILDRLRALSKAENPPIHEVEKWYRRLDQMIHNCSTEDFEKIKNAFHKENIVLTENSGWSKADSVFITSNEEDVPDAAVVKAAWKDLSIWEKIGIIERPTVDLAIEWLGTTLRSGETLSPENLKRVKSLISRHPEKIWGDCEHWLNLAGEWVSIETLKYALTMQTLLSWKHLHAWVKQQTADFQSLGTEITKSNPFRKLTPLVNLIEDRLQDNASLLDNVESKPWLNLIGEELRRIELESEEETDRIRILANDLAETIWSTTQDIKIIPYIDGKPAGTPRRVDVHWSNRTLYVDHLPNAKLAKIIPETLGRVFDRPDITAALNYCFERKPEDIKEYFEENFKLVSPDDVKITGKEKTEKPESNKEDTKPPESNDKEVPTIEGLTKEDERNKETVDEDNEDNVLTNENDKEQKVHHPSKPQPRLIEIYAKKMGFQRDGENRFFHEDGRCIEKTFDKLFPWEMRNSKGEIIRYYWVENHCLEKEPLQIKFEIWTAMEGAPFICALILVNESGEPVEKLGAQLKEMRNRQEIEICPATYRLVYKNMT
ncbi:MAG: hypothetical protein JW976_00915 [Syntrophaceae bacterium]|nr:hypothetical protein [Syntrophaceae bacterium]